MNRNVFYLLILFPHLSYSAPTDLSFKAKIVSLKDAKTKTSVVRAGGKVQVQLKVFLTAKGAVNDANREWLAQSLPKTVKGFLENHNRTSRQIRRFVNLKFQLNPKNIHCLPAENPRFEICRVEYTRPGGNTIAVPAGTGGEHHLSVGILPSFSLAKIDYEKNEPRIYHVTETDRRLSYIPFLGSVR